MPTGRRIDLQTHTHYSDGSYSPRQVVRLASQYGFGAVAITDHHSVRGIAEAEQEGKRRGIKIIPGIELYAQHRGKGVHILGYDMDLKNREFLRFVERTQREHATWLLRLLQKIRKAGFVVPERKMAASHSEFLGFGELIGILTSVSTNKKIIRRDLGTPEPDLFDIINFYFQRGGVAFVPIPEQSIPASRVIGIITKAGGVAVLAHPGITLSFREDGVVEQLKRVGLRGIEAITPHHTWHQMYHYQRMATRLRLFITAGSDLHGQFDDHRFLVQHRWEFFQPNQFSIPWRKKR